MLQNGLKRLLGIEYPIIQGGMAHISTGAFAAAVSEAGALGTIATAARDGVYVREQIKAARKLTKRPFSVNIMLANPYCKEIIDVVLDEGVSLVITGAGSPAPYMKDFLSNGCKVISVVPHVRAAVKVEDLGVAAVVAEEALDLLDAPIRRVTAPFTHIPFNRELENAMYPDRFRIAAAVRGIL